MDLNKLMIQVKNGEITPEEAVLKLKMEPFEDLDFAKIDHHRTLRQGVSEIIYGHGKTPEQILEISRSLLHKNTCAIVTRIDEGTGKFLIDNEREARYYPEARMCIVGKNIEPVNDSYIVIVTGGTSDIPVAEEAAITLEALGNNVKRIYDVGVSGIHRLFSNLEIIMGAKVVIAVAGMEGALASVVGGLVDVPVIAVPTSIGYGTSYDGLAALLAMLNSCASGVSVVNIDNGFGAGYIASMINHIGES